MNNENVNHFSNYKFTDFVVGVRWGYSVGS